MCVSCTGYEFESELIALWLRDGRDCFVKESVDVEVYTNYHQYDIKYTSSRSRNRSKSGQVILPL